MAKARLKVIVKWGVFLMIFSMVIIFGVSFLAGFLGVTTFLGAILALPFSYLFCYKATQEYLTGGQDRYQKNIGINIGLGVVLVATFLGAIVGYLLTGQINISIGLVPLILGVVAGKKAENSFLRFLTYGDTA